LEISFKQNMNNAERVIRVLLGILLIYMAAFDAVVLSSFWNIVIWILGIAFFLEGAAAY